MTPSTARSVTPGSVAAPANVTKQSFLHPLLIHASAACKEYRDSERRVTQILAPVHLSAARCLVLEALARKAGGSATVSEVSAFLGIHRTSAAATVEYLVAIGLIDKSIDCKDARKSEHTSHGPRTGEVVWRA